MKQTEKLASAAYLIKKADLQADTLNFFKKDKETPKSNNTFLRVGLGLPLGTAGAVGFGGAGMLAGDSASKPISKFLRKPIRRFFRDMPAKKFLLRQQEVIQAILMGSGLLGGAAGGAALGGYYAPKAIADSLNSK